MVYPQGPAIKVIQIQPPIASGVSDSSPISLAESPAHLCVQGMGYNGIELDSPPKVRGNKGLSQEKMGKKHSRRSYRILSYNLKFNFYSTWHLSSYLGSYIIPSTPEIQFEN